jgi:hypothetical protein
LERGCGNRAWYHGSPYHVEQFKTADGKTLLDSKVQDLVSAMAGFTPPALGQTTLPDSYKAAILPVVASLGSSIQPRRPPPLMSNARR